MDNQLSPHLQEILDKIIKGDRVNLLEENLAPEELETIRAAAASHTKERYNVTSYAIICPFCGSLLCMMNKKERGEGGIEKLIAEDRKSERAMECWQCGRRSFIKTEREPDPWIGRKYPHQDHNWPNLTIHCDI